MHNKYKNYPMFCFQRLILLLALNYFIQYNPKNSLTVYNKEIFVDLGIRLYTRDPIVARALGLAASKGILHTRRQMDQWKHLI